MLGKKKGNRWKNWNIYIYISLSKAIVTRISEFYFTVPTDDTQIFSLDYAARRKATRESHPPNDFFFDSRFLAARKIRYFRRWSFFFSFFPTKCPRSNRTWIALWNTVESVLFSYFPGYRAAEAFGKIFGSQRDALWNIALFKFFTRDQFCVVCSFFLNISFEIDDEVCRASRLFFLLLLLLSFFIATERSFRIIRAFDYPKFLAKNKQVEGVDGVRRRRV